jgi:hypothetical protein
MHMHPLSAARPFAVKESTDVSLRMSKVGCTSRIKSLFATCTKRPWTIHIPDASRPSKLNQYPFPSCPSSIAMTSLCLCLVLLRIHNAVLLNLRLVVVVHGRYIFEDGRGPSAREALDDVYVVIPSLVVAPSFVHIMHPAHLANLLYSCVIVPFASIMACLAASTTLSGVSLGQLMITDLSGAAAMARAEKSATKTAVRAKRILLAGGS